MRDILIIFLMFSLFNTLFSGKLIGKGNIILYNKYFLSQITKSQNLITNKNNNIFCEKDIQLYLNKNNFIKDKKLISISPGGIKGFYLMGILNYIKQNYDLTEYIFSGASAGSWNSLFMCLNKDSNEFVYKILNSDLTKSKSINELEYSIKYKILKYYNDDDFDLARLFIGVTTVQNWQTQTSIFSDFDNLEDAINCCIASSHIPLVTGGLSNRYHDMYTFDGGFSTYPYLNFTKSVLHIHPSMWNINKPLNNSQIKNKIRNFLNFNDFIYINKNINFIELYDNGYADAKQNKDMLDNIFIEK